MKTIALFTTNSWNSALPVLRVRGPAEQCGLQVLRGTAALSRNDVAQVDERALEQAELFVVQRDFPRHWLAFEKVTTYARQRCVPLVYDLDDLLLALPPEHPDRLSGYYAAALLPMLAAISQAGLVTASTLRLAAALQPYTSNVRVLPNLLDDRLWRLRPPAEVTGAPLVIGYMGGGSHGSDLELVAGALERTLARYPGRVHLRFWGAEPPAPLRGRPEVSWRRLELYHYPEFAAYFLRQRLDIALAPLVDNEFNRSKSAVKYLEYTALGAAGIYSPLETYTQAVSDGETGLLASTEEEWEAALARLVEQPTLRLHLAQAAQESVRSHWLLSRRAPEWLQAYQSAGQIGDKPTAGLSPQEGQPDSLSYILTDIARQGYAHQQHAQASEQDRLNLAVRLDTLEIQHTALAVQHAETAQTMQALNTRLLEIYASRAWKLVEWIWRLRLKLAPKDGLLERALRGLYHAVRPSRPVPAPSSPSEGTGDEGAGGAPLPGVNSIIQRIEYEGVDPDACQPADPSCFDIIVLPIMEWASRVQRPQQLACQFARAGHRVFYAHTSFRLGQLARVRPVAGPRGERVFEIELPSPEPVNLYQDALDPALEQTLMGAFEALHAAFGMYSAVILVDLPFWAPMALRLREVFGWRVVYDCMDYHAGFSTNTGTMLAVEDRLVAESDLVLVTARSLEARVTPYAKQVLRLPNGADYEHFALPPVDGNIQAAAFGSGPVIGYYGAIADWFDTQLVGELARRRPGWQFVLVGSTRYADLSPLDGLPNVQLLGEQPYERLPIFLHQFDAAIIPFTATPLTHATNPVKLFEYLSAGKPVVATDLEELRQYAEFVRLAASPDEWLSQLEAALDENTPFHIAARQDFARRNTWEQRFALLFPQLDALYPLASILVVTYNNLDYTRQCLESLFARTAYPRYEVIVVDNASQDGTPDYLRSMQVAHPELRLVLNEGNAGFARANNQGAALARGELLVLLNNDTVLPPGWLAGLARHLGDPAIGLVGPVTNFSGNETRIPVEYSAIDDMPAFARRYTHLHHGKIFDIPILAFLCAAMRKEVYDEVGPLDERFGVGMFEDDDYALRLRLIGFRVVCAEDVYVHHWGRASFSQLEQAAYQQLFETNRRQFEEKWGRPWVPHRYRPGFTFS